MVDQLLNKYPLISDQVDRSELRIILNEFAKVLALQVPGDVVEFGCYGGTTSLFLARLLRSEKSTKKLFCYDSFAGLPAKTREDSSGVGTEFKAGELAVTKADFMRELAKYFPSDFTRQHIKVVKNWFSQIPETKLPTQISFAFFDGDFYDSICDSFAKTDDRFASRAVIVVDDYKNEKLPGAARAVNEWCHRNRQKIIRFREENSLGIIYLR